MPRVTFDAAGRVTGLYNDDAAFPDAATEITEDERMQLAEYPDGWRWDGTALIAYTPPPPPVDLDAYTASAHAALRDGGVTVGGMRIKTDAESRGLIDGTYALSAAQPDTAIDFKAASGWVTIDAATMQTVAIAVGKWVQACYSAYRQIDSKVTDGTFTTTAQIDAAFAAVALPA
jgi:hypothetical protein